jgi:hypothetical protein
MPAPVQLSGQLRAAPWHICSEGTELAPPQLPSAPVRSLSLFGQHAPVRSGQHRAALRARGTELAPPQLLSTCSVSLSLFGQHRAALRPASRSSSAYLQRGYRASAAATPLATPLSTCSVSLSLFGQHRAALRPASRSSSAYLHVAGRILRTVDSMRADRPSPPTPSLQICRRAARTCSLTQCAG